MPANTLTPTGTVHIDQQDGDDRRPSPSELFLGWLASFEKADEVRPDGASGAVLPLSLLLGGLVMSTERLTADALGTLGMPDGSTVGEAATELLLAVTDPAGPRCRSYRSAVYYLHDLDRTECHLQDSV